MFCTMNRRSHAVLIFFQFFRYVISPSPDFGAHTISFICHGRMKSNAKLEITFSNKRHGKSNRDLLPYV